MLHGVDDSDSVLSVSADELRSLIRAVRARDHALVSLETLLFGPAPDNAVALTFDDGFESLYRAARPVLKDEAAPATLFLTTGYVGRDNRWPSQMDLAPRFEMMSWDQVEALHADGWAIEAHSVDHPDLRGLSDEAVVDQMVDSRDTIERRLGRRSRIFAYPYGFMDSRVADLARPHFGYAVTARMGWLTGPTDAMRVPRLDAFYLRRPGVHRGFGGASFRAFLRARIAMRRARNNPCETE